MNHFLMTIPTMLMTAFAATHAFAGQERCPPSVRVTADLDITQSYIADWLNPRLASPGKLDFSGTLKTWVAVDDDCLYLDPEDPSQFFSVELLPAEMHVTFNSAYFYFAVPLSDLSHGQGGEYPILTNISDGSIMIPQPGTAKNVLLR